MKQKMMFFAFAVKRGVALTWLEINPFNASMPKPQEACWRKPRRVNAGAIEPGQIGCFMASQELAKIGGVDGAFDWVSGSE